MSLPEPLAEEAERRVATRIPLSEKATLLQGHLGSATQCTLMDLSLDGCRVRADGEIRVDCGARVELVFRACGTAFRLGGVTEWTGRAREVGVAFTEMSPRREAELVEALGELAEKLEAKRAEAARADEALRPARELVERLAAEFEAKSAREARARAEAEQAAREARQAWEKLDAAKKDLAYAEKVAAELARSLPAGIESGGEAEAAAKSASGLMVVAGGAEAPVAGAGKAAIGEAGKPAAGRSGRERRQAARHAVDSTATVFLVDVRSNLRGRIVDVSMSGCRIRAAERFPVGIYRRVEVEFLLDGLPFRLPGVVQSVHDRFTAGIRFIDLSERKREQLSFVIEEIEEAAGSEAGNRE